MFPHQWEESVEHDKGGAPTSTQGLKPVCQNSRAGCPCAGGSLGPLPIEGTAGEAPVRHIRPEVDATKSILGELCGTLWGL